MRYRTKLAGSAPGLANSLDSILDIARESVTLCPVSILRPGKSHTCRCPDLADHISDMHYCNYCKRVFH